MKAPLSEIFANVGVRFIRGHAMSISTETNTVTYADEDGLVLSISYSKLVLATGSVLHRPDIQGLVHAFNVDQLADAAELEDHISRLARLPETRARNTVVVAGGGFTGIETAAEMPHRMRAALGDNADIRVVIVERAPAIGPDLGPGPRPIIERALSELGVETLLLSPITEIDPKGVTLTSGERIDAATVIWTAGARANPITSQIDADKDSFGRLHVDRNLKVIGHENVFATGDVACAATDDNGNRTMMSCQHAQNLGRSSGYNVAADLLGVPPHPLQPGKVRDLPRFRSVGCGLYRRVGSSGETHRRRSEETQDDHQHDMDLSAERRSCSSFGGCRSASRRCGLKIRGNAPTWSGMTWCLEFLVASSQPDRHE